MMVVQRLPTPGRVAQGGCLPAETRAYVGGITKTLKQANVSVEMVKLTRPDGKTVKRAGYTLTIFRKQNGKWLLARDANLMTLQS